MRTEWELCEKTLGTNHNKVLFNASCNSSLGEQKFYSQIDSSPSFLLLLFIYFSMTYFWTWLMARAWTLGTWSSMTDLSSCSYAPGSLLLEETSWEMWDPNKKMMSFKKKLLNIIHNLKKKLNLMMPLALAPNFHYLYILFYFIKLKR